MVATKTVQESATVAAESRLDEIGLSLQDEVIRNHVKAGGLVVFMGNMLIFYALPEQEEPEE